jgi:hypothetical protein
MLRTIHFFSLLLLGTGGTVYGSQAVAQVVNPTGLDRWDSTNEVLFYGDGSPDRLVRAYAGGHQRGADIDIFKDFAGIQEDYVDSLTAGPDGTTLIAAILNFGGHNIRRAVLTYDSSGQLLKTWEPVLQYAEVVAYSKDDDAIFVLGDRYVPDGPDAPDYPLLVEYNRDGRVLKNMIPASTLKDAGNSFSGSGQTGEPALRVTKDHIYFYAPANREAVMCDRNGVILTYRSIGDIVDKIISTEAVSLATPLSAFVFNNIAGCHSQAICDITPACYTLFASFWLRLFVFSVHAGASCSKTLRSASNSSPSSASTPGPA